MNEKEAKAFLREHIVVVHVTDDEPQEPDWIYQDCPHCGQSNTPMGLLGKLNHFCCRACGWWYT